MTPQDVITEARNLLSDTAGVRWPDLTLLTYVEDGVHETFRLRPDLFLRTDDTISTRPAVGITGTLPLGTEHRKAISYYVAFRALAEESDDRANMKRSQEYFKIYQESL